MNKLNLRLVNMPGGGKKHLKKFGAFKFLHELFDEVKLYSSKPDFVLFSYWGDREDYMKYDCSKIFYSAEYFSDRDPQHFKDCDFSFGPHYRDKHYYRLPNYLDWYGLDTYYQLNKRPEVNKSFARRKFCAYLYSNPAKYSAPIRTEIFKKLSKYRTISSGGEYLNNCSRVPNNARATLDFIRRHKFWIAFENKSGLGYTTEKLYNGFVARSLPIYWGNERVDEDFNENAFINVHNYDRLEDVIELIKMLDNDIDKYMEYLNAPVFPNGKIPKPFRKENLKAVMKRVFVRRQF